jgi:hypothetical protein
MRDQLPLEGVQQDVRAPVAEAMRERLAAEFADERPGRLLESAWVVRLAGGDHTVEVAEKLGVAAVNGNGVRHNKSETSIQHPISSATIFL